MNLLISNKSSESIYLQIYNQIKTAIIKGVLKENDALPSIRNLAKDLRVSVITTKRSYEELEKEGYIYTIAGKGSFVAEKNMELIKENYLKEIEDYMRIIYSIAKTTNIDKDVILEMFGIIYEEEEL